MEHGTIHFIQEHYGPGVRVGGRANYNGFRVSGIKDQKDIRDAFKRMADCYARGNRDEIIAVSRGCGSNIVTAQGFGMVLLTITGVMSLVLNLNTTVSLLLLGLNVVIYILLRHRLGNWIQERFFISLDFKDVRIEWIRSVPKKFFERNHTYFIKTRFS